MTSEGWNDRGEGHAEEPRVEGVLKDTYRADRHPLFSTSGCILKYPERRSSRGSRFAQTNSRLQPVPAHLSSHSLGLDPERHS